MITDLGDRVLQFGPEFERCEGRRREIKAFNAAIWTFRDGKVVGFDAYAHRSEALKRGGTGGVGVSQENGDRYRELHEAIDRREVREDLLTPDFRMENLVTAVTDKTYLGAVGVGERTSDTFDGLAEGARYAVEEIPADGDGFVVGRVAIVGHGARSGLPLHLRWIDVCWFSDGKVTRAGGYGSRAEAIKAVGLEE